MFQTELAKQIYMQKYSMGGKETWAYTCKRVVTNVCGSMVSNEVKQGIYDSMVNRKFIPGGRYLYASGRPIPQVNNCFLFRADDSREGWAKLMHDATHCLMTGGGIGTDYSEVRPEGSLIRGTGGTSTGPIALMHMVNEGGRYIMQGGQRRSAIWAGLIWSHPDIFKFMSLKNHSEDVRALKAKDFNFPLSMELTNISVNYDTEFFEAYENKDHPKHELAHKVWKKNCLQAFSTAEPGMAFNYKKDRESLRNAPVHAVTRVLTKDGYRYVGDIVGQEETLWTGKQWAKATFKMTNECSKIFSVHLSNGSVISCDPTHPFMVRQSNGVLRRVAANKLTVGASIGADLPKDKEIQDADAEDFLKGLRDAHSEVSPDLKKTSLDYIAGLFSELEVRVGNSVGIRLAEGSTLRRIREELDTYGVRSTITVEHRTDAEYCCFLQVLPESMVRFKTILAAYPNKVDIPDEFRAELPTEIRVTKVYETNIEAPVYCCDVGVPEHSFMAEGVLISNCTEVTSEDNNDKCNLGTLWLPHIKDYDDLHKTAELATKFLMCGGVYSYVPYAEIKEVGDRNNRIGLGIGGLHEWLMLRGSSYEVSPEMHKWLEAYRDTSDATAFTTAAELGVTVPKGVRAIAPNGTIGILAETTTGIEPLFCSAYKRRYLKNKSWHYQYVIDGAVKRLMAAGVKPEAIQDAYTIGFEERIKFQADVQDYVDMAISSTCNMKPWGSGDNDESNVDEKADILYSYAKRLRGFTCYPDGCRAGQPLTKVDLMGALQKEGKVFEETVDECLNGVCGV